MTLHLFHDWLIVDVAPCVDTSFGGRTDGTIVLYRCTKCGKATTDFITGRWTAEQLRGKT